MIFKLLQCLFIVFYTVKGEMSHSSVQRRTATLRKLTQPCVVIVTEKSFKDLHVDVVSCELVGQDIPKGKVYHLVHVDGLTTDWAKKNKVISGSTTIFSDNAKINDKTGALVIPRGGKVKLGRKTGSSAGGKQVTTVGTKTVLILRVDAQDSRTSASEAELADDVFGSSGDQLNLKSQYSACSDGKLTFVPLKTNSIVGTDGVYTVKLPKLAVNGMNDGALLTEVINAASSSLGARLDTIASHVMICLPPGTQGAWIAYGYFNSYLTVYNDDWCRFPSAQMHEIGHNMNLGHSNEGSTEYGDQTGMMGYSYSEDEKIRMCFNGGHTWALGWYSSYHVDLPIDNSYEWTGFLVGFAEKQRASSSDKMIIRIRNTVDTYIHFNRMIGANSETIEGGDMVLISSSEKTTSYVTTNLLAKLTLNGMYKLGISVNGKRTSIYIKVTSLNLSTVPARAGITISTKANNPVPSPTLAPTLRPTPDPTFEPTLAPVAPPTESPVTPWASPVRPPISSPVRPPVEPTEAPIAPTPPPTLSPPINVLEYQIKSQWSGDYLTLSNNTAGAPITLEPWNAEWWSQRWYRESADDPDFPNHRWLRCKWDDYYLDATGADNNAYVVGWNLEPDWWSLRWSLKKIQGNIYQIINLWSGLCLSAIQSSDGYVDVVVRDCRSFWTQQQWVLQRVSK